MRKLFFLGLVMLILSYITAHAELIEGGVEKQGVSAQNRVVDSATNMPVPYAKVILPKQNYTTYTDGDGRFNLDARIQDNSILAVEKEGYRPFSLTLNTQDANNPMVVGIEKSKPLDLVIESDIIHVGDNAYSDNSANSFEFKAQSVGAYYSKEFNVKKNSPVQNNYLLIGSLIGLDTRLAQTMGQNKIHTAYSSPVEIYLNGVKISELHLNGDNQKIKLSSNLVRNGANEVTIKTGRNMMEYAYIDYDDIEFMNLTIVTE